MDGKKRKLDPQKTMLQLKVRFPGIDPPIFDRKLSGNIGTSCPESKVQVLFATALLRAE